MVNTPKATEMKLVVEESVLSAFPSVRIGVLALRNVDNHIGADLASKLLEAQEHVRTTFAGLSVADHPRIHCWREAYRAFGAKPKKYPSSIENLVRRTLEGEALRSINPLVDLYNVVSLQHLLPVGGEDLDAVEGDIRLRRARDDEPMMRLLGEQQERAPKTGEVIYADDRGAICRRWNWKEADRTKLTEHTQHAVLVLEALPPVGRSELEEAMAALDELVRAHTGAETRARVVDQDDPELDLGS
jgi:DNA/RNA-binding domain of Phe-tRNA-synthetase-like protein